MVAMGKELDAHSARVRDSIHDQNDLVLMISIMMEMPIPYTNIGGLVTDLFQPHCKDCR